MYRLIFLYATLLFSLPLFAETINNDDRDTLYLDFSDQQLVLPNDLPFVINRVIDARGIDSPVGIAHKGLGNRAVAVMIKDGIDNAWTSLFQQVNAENNVKLPNAVLRITGLRIDEFITAMKEVRRITIEGELAYPSNGDFAVYGPVQLLEISGGLDVTSGHSRATAELLTKLVWELQKLVLLGEVSHTIPAANIDQPVSSFPIEDTNFNSPADGVYLTYMDYRAGRVDTSLQLPIAHQEILYTNEALELLGGDLDRPEAIRWKDLDVWGFQFQSKSYVRLRRDFY